MTDDIAIPHASFSHRPHEWIHLPYRSKGEEEHYVVL